MSHLIPRAPNAQAINALGESLAATARERRRQTSLQTCHRPAFRAPVSQRHRDTEAFTPQYSARLLNDPHISDGARRCGAKLMELAYRRDRAGRAFKGTVSYLAKCLGRSERTIQIYLAQLRGRGYVRHEVIASEQARMSVGIRITLLAALFPRHHRQEWPAHAMKSGVKRDSENYRIKTNMGGGDLLIPVEHWTLRCMDGVFRSFMKTIGPQGALA